MRTLTNVLFKEWQALPPLSLTLNLVGTRSTASPSLQQEVWDAGVTRPYQMQRAGQDEGKSHTNRSAKFTPMQP